MKRYALPILLLSLLTTFSVGCDSDSGSEDDSIEGLWSLVTEEGEEEDILYFRISGESVTTYDFMGDEFDAGEDCYLIESYQFEHVSGDTYRMSDQDENSLDFVAQVSGNRLTLTNVFFGTETYVRSNRNVSEFTPECSEEDFEFSTRRLKLQS